MQQCHGHSISAKSVLYYLFNYKGSWLAGVDGALPGIWMQAHPKVGEKYRQEYLKGAAEDTAEVLSLHETVTVPFGTFRDCLKTIDDNPLETGTAEYKYYCPAVKAPVLEVVVATGERSELTGITYAQSATNENTVLMSKMQQLITLLKQFIATLLQQK